MKTRFKYTNYRARVHRRLVYIYLLSVPCVSCRYFNKINRTSYLGKLPALSLEILKHETGLVEQTIVFKQLKGYTNTSAQNGKKKATNAVGLIWVQTGCTRIQLRETGRFLAKTHPWAFPYKNR